MPKYQVTSPTGATYEYTVPEGVTEAEVVAFAQQQNPESSKPAEAPAAADVPLVSGGATQAGGASSKQLTSEQTAQYLALAKTGSARELEALVKSFGGFTLDNADEIVRERDRGRGINTNVTVQRPKGMPVPDGGATGAAMRGAGDALLFGGLDEAQGLSKTAGQWARGELGQQSFGDALSANITGYRDEALADQELHPYARAAGQVVAGLATAPLLPGAGVRGIGGLAATGAGYGALYGAGSGDSGSQRLSGALLQAGLGAVGGAAFGGVARGLGAIPGRVSPRRVAGDEVMRAARELGTSAGVDATPLAADVGGDLTRRVTGGMAQSEIAGGSIQAGANRVTDAARQVRDAAGTLRTSGTMGDAFAGGTAVADGVRDYVGTSGRNVRQLYGAARRQTAGVGVQPAGALAEVDAQLNQLAATSSTDAPVISALQRVGLDLTDPAGVSVDTIRRVRTNIRALTNTENLHATDFERRAGLVLAAATRDYEAALNPTQLAAFRAADRAHAERMSTIDNVLKPIVGGRGDKALAPEKVFSNLVGIARSDSDKLRRAMAVLPVTERDELTASVIAGLGRSSNGRQNAAGDAFSLSEFLTHWNQLPPRSRNTLFTGPVRRELDNIARVAQGTKESQRYVNTSNTAGSARTLGFFGGGGALGFLAGGPGGAAATAASTVLAPYVLGRVLASPALTRLLSRPLTTGQQAERMLAGLTNLAARQPALVDTVADVKGALEDALRTQARGAKISYEEPVPEDVLDDAPAPDAALAPLREEDYLTDE